jgi:integrase/recombinase XerD
VRTPAEYVRILDRFLAGLPSPEVATAADVHAFAYGPGPSGKVPSPSTVVVRLAALSGFYDFARRMDLVSRNPAAEVKRPRQRQPLPRGLGAGELRLLLAAVPATPSGLRDRAIIITAVLTALRRSEVLGLQAGDLTRNGSVYFRVRTKGGVERRRELPAPAFAAITSALAACGRTLEKMDPDDRLFDVSSAGFYANLRRYASRAGLNGVTPHVLRHSAAKLRRDSGSTLEQVSALLGHRNLATTSTYLARLEGDEDQGWRSAAALLGV